MANQSEKDALVSCQVLAVRVGNIKHAITSINAAICFSLINQDIGADHLNNFHLSGLLAASDMLIEQLSERAGVTYELIEQCNSSSKF